MRSTASCRSATCLDPWVADLGELLVGELCFERLRRGAEPFHRSNRRSCAARRGSRGQSVLGALTPLLGFMSHSVQVKRAVLVVAAARGNRPCVGFSPGVAATRRATSTARRSRINVSDTYPVDPALTQDWATFFGSLMHGRELASLTGRSGAARRGAEFLQPQALACYDPDSQTIEASPEDQLNAPAAKGDRHARVRAPRREQQPQHTL